MLMVRPGTQDIKLNLANQCLTVQQMWQIQFSQLSCFQLLWWSWVCLWKGWLCIEFNCNDLQQASISKRKKWNWWKIKRCFQRHRGQLFHCLRLVRDWERCITHFKVIQDVWNPASISFVRILFMKQCTGSTTVNNQTWLQDWASYHCI